METASNQCMIMAVLLKPCVRTAEPVTESFFEILMVILSFRIRVTTGKCSRRHNQMDERPEQNVLQIHCPQQWTGIHHSQKADYVDRE